MPKPYRQGQLDGLCGVYALVNAVDVLCGPLSKRQARALFQQILTFLEARGPLAERCTNGIVIHDIAAILKHVICPQYPIHRSKPFHCQARIDKQHYLQTLQAFLQQPQTIALVGLEGYHSHWTLLHRITDKTLMAHDSAGLHYLLQSSCSIYEVGEQKLHWLFPAQTYLLSSR
jgi:hypothetical protein